MMIEVSDDWLVRIETRTAAGRTIRGELPIALPDLVTVADEHYPRLPVFDDQVWGGWKKGVALTGLLAQECTAKDALDPSSLVVRGVADADEFVRGQDYDADLAWGSLGRLAGGRIAEDEPVSISYRYAKLRIDSLVLEAGDSLAVKQGRPDIAMPQPPALAPDQARLANIFVDGRLARLGPQHLFPILELSYPEPAVETPTAAESRLPRTMAKLTGGDTVHILAWGDSVTDASYLPSAATDRWQVQFAARLRQRFPSASIDLTTEAWGGRNTASYLAEPPGALHNYAEKVLAARPDLIVSEFVNDAGLSPDAVAERYGGLLADFRAIGAEWIILTPHYVRPDWMALTSQRDIDDDPRPYVHGLRAFAEQHGVALADASLRWGRLWRQGIPYSTLLHNTINHPDARGMKMFADSLMALFPR